MTGAADDLVVVGGGLIGLSIAFEAACQGLRGTLVSWPRSGEATAAAGGMLTPLAEAEGAAPELLRAAVRSCELYPAFLERLERVSGQSCGYGQHGTLLVALTSDHERELEHLERFQKEVCLPVRRLGPREMRDLEPGITPRQLGGMHFPADQYVDPGALVSALRLALDALGFARMVGQAKEMMQERGRVSGVVVASEKGTETRLPCSRVVLAGGVWSGSLAGAPLPLRPVKGQGVLLQGPRVSTLRHVVRTPDVYLVPRLGDRLYVGASSEEAGLDARPIAGFVLELLGRGWRVFPELYECPVVELPVGFRPALPDHRPAVGPWGPDGCFVATGHYRHGVMLAPQTARWMAELLSGEQADADLRAFQPARFSAMSRPLADASAPRR